MKKSIINIRFLAIVLVVLGHSIILYSNDWSIYKTSYNLPILDLLKYLINIFSMPLFFSISGYLFQLSKKTKAMSFIKKKAKRLIVPYICISIIWLIPIRLLVKYPGYENKKITEIFVNGILMGNDNGHLWYLPTLFLCFIIIYFLKNKFNNKKIISYVIFLSSSLIYIFPISIFKISYLNFTLQYYCWFYLGYLIFSYEKKLQKVPLIKLLLLTLLFTILTIIFRYNILLINNFFKYISGICWVLLIYKLVSKIKTNKIIEYVSCNSFGIYLFHSPLVYITFSKMANYNPKIIIFINFVIFGGLALLLTNVISILKVNL